MNELQKIQIELVTDPAELTIGVNDFENIIFDLNSQIEMLSSKADKWDCLVALGSGIVCGMMDIFWTGEFSLAEGRDMSSQKVDDLVKKTAKMMGCESDDLKKCVKFLEEKFPIPADGNTPDFGGGLQHHLRDFAHHPTIVGLVFSLLTQFTYKSYGTDVAGNFLIVDVPEKSRIFIGEDTPSKIINGTLVWFFHLISDIAGSSSTAGLSGGTGIPGPILSIAKEMSVLPFFKNIKKDDMTFSVFLSKLFNGTLLAKHDENGKIIKDTVAKMDLRGEMGVAIEIGKQTVPVIANECIVRTFYMIRQLAQQIKQIHVTNLEDFKKIRIEEILPVNSPSLTRMLTIATGVFTALDVSEAVITKKYWVSINYVGIGRFTLALGDEMVWALKRRDVRKIKDMYETIYRNTYTDTDQRIYERIGDDMEYDKFGLNEEQTEILYNLEYYKALHDIESTKIPVGGEKIRQLKREWLEEWKGYMTSGFTGFMNSANAELNWYNFDELNERIKANNPDSPWFRLVLLEAMLFEPYFPLTTETDKKGNEVPSKKYSSVNTPIAGYKKSDGDKYLDDVFAGNYHLTGYVKRLRKSYDKVCRELNEVLKTAITSIAITAGVAIITRVMMVQFHQSYSYEDFIMGFRPSATGFELKKGAFYNFCKNAETDSDNDYFFIIDEINRGNLSKIFGELFMLIETDKRGIELQLLYSDERFSVPANVYIIGMMNTADRSLAMLDYALRRRFAFINLKPGFETEGFRTYRMGLENDKFNHLIAAVETLNNVIAADDSLGEGFCIGHSYFCNLNPDNLDDQALSAIVEFELIPLLKEYWFDEPTKVRDWSNNLRSATK